MATFTIVKHCTAKLGADSDTVMLCKIDLGVVEMFLGSQVVFMG